MLGDQYKYPEWSRYLSWALTLSSILCIPIYIIYKVLITPGGFKHVCFFKNLLFRNISKLIFVTQRMRVCFQPERRTPSAVPGQITGSDGTSVWHAQCKPTTNSQPKKTTTNGINIKQVAASVPLTQLPQKPSEYIVCPMETHFDSSIRINENFDYDYDRYNFKPRSPLSLAGHFQHFRDSEELYEPGPFRTEWLVWRALVFCLNFIYFN